ncbi:unnamed protein product [Amoebophrya sp. A120]|nr:unnamed protein product [Amoebophrya sp. A120]|eukprot:GSA120T00005043001.1
MTSSPIAVIVGAGSKHDQQGASDISVYTRYGLGGALGMKFAEQGFNVVLTARRTDVLEKVANECKSIQKEKGLQATTISVPMDLTSDDQVKSAFDQIKASFPDAKIECLVFNAGTPFPPGFSFGDDAMKPHELDVSFLNMAHDTQIGGLIRCTRECVPDMLERKSGAILLSGATMQLRGGAKFGGIAPGKTALRSLGQSMYQTYGPLGVHVCNINIDGVIDSPATRAWGMPVEKMMPPEDIAEQFVAMYKQPKSCWSYEIMCTPAHSAPTVGMRM